MRSTSATVGDLLHHYPRRYIDRSRVSTIGAVDARCVRDRDRDGAQVSSAARRRAAGRWSPSRSTTAPARSTCRSSTSPGRRASTGRAWRSPSRASRRSTEGRLQLAKQEVEILRGDEIRPRAHRPHHPGAPGVRGHHDPDDPRARCTRRSPELPDDRGPDAEARSSAPKGSAPTTGHCETSTSRADRAPLDAARERLKFDELFTLELGVAFRKHRVEAESAGSRTRRTDARTRRVCSRRSRSCPRRRSVARWTRSTRRWPGRAR